MTTTNSALTFWERNDEVVNLTITRNSAVFDLTGAVVEVYIKTSADQTDQDGALLSTDTAGVTVTDAPNGAAVLEVPAAQNVTPGQRVFRVDVIDSAGKRKTAGTGTITTVNT